jgi:subtilase family serine protease
MNAATSCTANFDLLPLLPDLVVSVLSAPASAGAGSQISVSETTKNQGGPAAASTTRYYLSANSTWEATDTPIGARAIGTLAAGASSPGTVQLTIPAGTATGNYYVLARADADGRIAESVETNNVRADSIHIGPPNLVVSAVSAPTLGGASLSITVTDTTRNQTGVGPAPASVTRFYLSRDSILDASDVLIGSRNVPALQPGDTSSGSTPLLIPAGTAPGAWSVIAKADGPDSISETSETDNTRSDTITIGPNLSVSSLSAPSNAGAGMSIAVTDTTKNSGGGSVAGSVTSFYLSANSSLGAGDVLLGGRSTGLISPASSTGSVSTSLTIPSGIAAGSYYIIAKADDADAVAETDETDNTRAVLIRISPDLIVSVLTVPASAAAGSTISVSDTTKNQGQGIAAATATRLYLSTNNVYEASDIPLGSRDVPLLAYGASSAGSTPIVIPPGTAAGTYYIVARADDGGGVAESNEGNNVASRAITISVP